MYPEWFTPTLRHSLHKLHSFRKKTRNKTSSCHKSAVAIAESKFETLVSESKLNYERAMVEKYASLYCPMIYNYIRSLSKESFTPSSVFYVSNSASTDGDKADIFHDFFQSVFKTNRIPLPDLEFLPSPAGPALESITFSEQDVYNILVSLGPSNATGPDKIPAQVLKLCSCSLTEPIHHLFTQCLGQSYVPTEWRTHRVIPVCKSGDKRSVANYHPNSLLCYCLKA